MAIPSSEKYRSAGSRLFILAGSYLVMMLLGSVVFRLVLLVAAGAAGNDAGQNIVLLKGMQLVMTIISFLVPALLVAKVSWPRGLPYLRVDKKFSLPVLLSVIVMILSVQPLMNALSVWFSDWSLPASLSGVEHGLKSMEQRSSDLVHRFLDVHSAGGLLFNILLVAIVPAVSEEFFFRGSLLQLLGEKLNIHLAVWLTAVIFSAVHLEVSGFLPRVFLGAFLGYLFVWTGSIWAPVAVHFVNNLFGVLTEFLIFNHYVDKSFDRFGTGATLWVSLLGTIVFAMMFAVVYRSRVTGLPAHLPVAGSIDK